MDSNTHSTSSPARLPALAAELQDLAAQDLDRLTDAALVDRALELQGLRDRLEVSGCAPWPPSTAAAPPAPKTGCRPARPLGGCGAGYG